MDVLDTGLLITETSRQFAKNNYPYALYGGLALAVYGVPRETKDVDHIIPDYCLNEACAVLLQHFPNAVSGFQKTKFGGLQITRLSLLSDDIEPSLLMPKSETPFNTIDLITPRQQDYTEKLLNRALSGEFRQQMVTVVAPEDFVILKVLSTRSYDLEDAKRIMQMLKELSRNKFPIYLSNAIHWP